MHPRNCTASNDQLTLNVGIGSNQTVFSSNAGSSVAPCIAIACFCLLKGLELKHLSSTSHPKLAVHLDCKPQNLNSTLATIRFVRLDILEVSLITFVIILFPFLKSISLSLHVLLLQLTLLELPHSRQTP